MLCVYRQRLGETEGEGVWVASCSTQPNNKFGWVECAASEAGASQHEKWPSIILYEEKHYCLSLKLLSECILGVGNDFYFFLVYFSGRSSAEKSNWQREMGKNSQRRRNAKRPASSRTNFPNGFGFGLVCEANKVNEWVTRQINAIECECVRLARAESTKVYYVGS